MFDVSNPTLGRRVTVFAVAMLCAVAVAYGKMTAVGQVNGTVLDPNGPAFNVMNYANQATTAGSANLGVISNIQGAPRTLHFAMEVY